ncbi:MAG: hypothetical protein ACI8SJ_001991 [Shewanella sp.]
MLLTYNPIRYQMVKMCHQLRGDYLPYSLSFNDSLVHIMRLLVGLPYFTRRRTSAAQALLRYGRESNFSFPANTTPHENS